MSQGSKKKYALIWWLQSSERDTVALMKIPQEYRKVGAVGEVIWKDNTTKKEIKSEMKVLAISTDEAALNKTFVNVKGEIIDQKNKIFDADVLRQKVEFKESTNLIEGLKKSNKNKLEEKIKNQLPIFSRVGPHFLGAPTKSSVQNCTPIQSMISNSNNSDNHMITSSAIFSSRPTYTIQNKSSVLSNQQFDDVQHHHLNKSIEEPEILHACEASTSTNEKKHVTNVTEVADKIAGLIPQKITKEVIDFLEAMTSAAKNIYAEYQEHDSGHVKEFTVPAHYFRSGDDKEEIMANSGFYLTKDKKSILKFRADGNWRKLVKETLAEVYGPNIVNFSAKGSASTSNPAINYRLFKGLFDWANKIQGGQIETKKYTSCINKCASNKRKYTSCEDKSMAMRKIIKMNGGGDISDGESDE